MAATGHFSCPPAGSFVAVSGQFLVAAVSAPLRRGRAGLTAPSVAQLVSESHTLAARTIRRHAADALDGLVEVARHRGLTL